MSEAPNPTTGEQRRDTVLAQAVDLQRGGRLAEAAEIYRRILADSPHDFDATQLLGVIALQQGQYYDAQRLLGCALDMDPRNTSVMANLGTSHMRVGDYEVALALFKSAVELQPESATWHANVGTVLHNMRRFADAIPPLRKAQLLDPGSFAISMLLGACLVGNGETAEAVGFFEAATRADPGDPEGWEQLAIALNALGRYQQGLDSAVTAQALNPRSPVALAAKGLAQYEQGDFGGAAQSYGEAVAIASPSVSLFAAYGNALVSCARYEEAIEQFARALELDGSRLSVRWAMTMAYLKPVYKDESDSAASRDSFAQALADVEAWIRQSGGAHEPFGEFGMLQPFYIAYQPVNNRELLGRYGSLCASLMADHPDATAACPGNPGASVRGRGGAKLRIGVVSSHIHQHSVWTAITRGWVYNIDAESFDVYLFKLDAWSDPETEKARGMVTRFDDRPKDLGGWVRSILEQELDAIIYPEIGMHALTLQLASLRLAPVQAAAWGHPETTGLPTMDLYLSADGFEPANAAANYVERLVRLPNLGVYVEPLSPAVADPDLGSLKLSGGDTLLLCPGTPFKYAPIYDAVWVQIAGQLRRKGFKWRGRGRLVFFAAVAR